MARQPIDIETRLSELEKVLESIDELKIKINQLKQNPTNQRLYWEISRQSDSISYNLLRITQL